MSTLARFIGFQAERWIQRGILHQLLIVAATITAIAVAGGLVAWIATDAFRDPLEAIWWSFLRLTDPGYLGDDEGAVLRSVSTIVTILGYVLFMGSLVAIMTQWLAERIGMMEEGLSPIAMRGHVVILGWTNRTPEIVRELMTARGRLRRFLTRQGSRSLRVVIVTDEDVRERRRELAAHLGGGSQSARTFMRQGSELSLGDLARFDLARAGAIIVPGDEFRHGDAEDSDANVVKTLLALRSILKHHDIGDRPRVVAEIADPRKVPAARRALDQGLWTVPGDAILGALMARAIDDPRLVEVYLTLLSHARGFSPYVKEIPETAGWDLRRLGDSFPRAVVLGVVRSRDGRNVVRLNPSADLEVESTDRIVFLAARSDDLVLDPTSSSRPDEPARRRHPTARTRRRVLVLGWSPKMGRILEELTHGESTEIELTMVSRLPGDRRARALEGHAIDTDRVRIEHVERDFTLAGTLEELEPDRYDRILLMASTDMATPQAADARTIIGYEMLKSILEARSTGDETGPDIVVELVDPGSEALLDTEEDSLLLVPRILGHLQAHIALFGEIGPVFDALLLSGRLRIRTAKEGPAPDDQVVAIMRPGARGDDRLGFKPTPEQLDSLDDGLVVVLTSQS